MLKERLTLNIFVKFKNIATKIKFHKYKNWKYIFVKNLLFSYIKINPL